MCEVPSPGIRLLSPHTFRGDTLMRSGFHLDSHVQFFGTRYRLRFFFVSGSKSTKGRPERSEGSHTKDIRVGSFDSLGSLRMTTALSISQALTIRRLVGAAKPQVRWLSDRRYARCWERRMDIQQDS